MTIKELKERLKNWTEETEILVYDGLDPSDLCIMDTVLPVVDRLTNKVYLELQGNKLAPTVEELE